MIVEDWMRRSVLKGLQGLMMLRLQGAPADDVIALMANAWIAVLGNIPHTWDEERDAPRIQQAFVVLAGKCERWPAPKHFIDCLPPVVPLLALDSPKAKHSEQSKRMVAQLLQRMRAS